MKVDIVIYSKDNCKYCVFAKDFLTRQRISFVEKKIGENITLEEVLALFPTVKTVPIIMIEGRYIGGWDELYKYAQSNGWMLA